MVLYEIYREDGGNGITFVHMLYINVQCIYIICNYVLTMAFKEHNYMFVCLIISYQNKST
jgi:hypothetical protein